MKEDFTLAAHQSIKASHMLVRSGWRVWHFDGDTALVSMGPHGSTRVQNGLNGCG